MSRIRLLKTASFRLAAIYLALFAASALALGAFVYLSMRHEILVDFDERIIEETDALRSAFAEGGRDRLAQMLDARGASGGAFAYGLQGADGRLIAGDLNAPAAWAADGWMEAREADSDEQPEAKPEIVRALATRLADGSTLVVGDERRRSDEVLHGVLMALGWAVAATIALGIAGGLWLSAQFLGRVNSMRQTAQRLMAGDWSRRIPLTRIDDDLTALARTFNRLFDRIEKLLLANKQVSADIAHDLRKPLACMLRRLEAALGRRGPFGSRCAAPSRRRSLRSKACSKRSTRFCASARSRPARGGRRSGRSISLKSRARSSKRSSLRPRKRERRSFRISMRRFRCRATRNCWCR